MYDTQATTKLFNDLFALEKNYRHNLLQLHNKTEEIERFKQSYKMLEEKLEIREDEVKELRAKLHAAEESLFDCEQKRENEKQVCQDVVNRLTVKINELNRRHNEELEENANEVKRRCGEMQNLHVQLLSEKHNQYRLEMEKLEEKLKKEVAAGLKLKSQTQSILDDNMLLRNNIRDMECRLIPEIALRKDEIKTMRSENANLVMEGRRRDADIARLSAQNGHLYEELQQRQVKTEELIKENNDLALRNDKLDAEIELSKKTSDTHYDVVHQNDTLREIVRGMRRDRERFLNESRIDAERTECKIARLEELVDKLKMAFVAEASGYSNGSLIQIGN